ncbi:toll-like receptor Tollo [Caerostris extrusa]|uniref:Toll-like receptor Tollo n=1 Tax=Caerostris extrusa TaxID=172846 RepID=A0AAV4VQK1_CAEEX|nr:toll-like receptor Tollo [Caerostris extrusa]
MEWLQHMNKLDGTIQYPHVIDLNEVICKLSFKRHSPYLPLSLSKSSDFLCKYGSHCFALCHCCEFDACDCEMVCPENCTCYSDQTWNTNIVDCSSQNFTSMPSVIPMDVTDLYLDGNNIFQLTSHTLIGISSLNLKWNPRLSRVQLGHNPWICNCDYLESYHEWLRDASSLVQDLGSIQCRYNQSAGPYLVEFNISSCSNYSSITYFQAVFQTDYIAFLIIALVLVLFLLISTILICIYRREIKVWLYSKYGIRLFKKNTIPPETEKLFDAYISYHAQDETFVNQFLAPELECGAPSYRLCIRKRDLPMSGYLAEAFNEAIECSHRTIVVLSKNFVNHQWCLYEIKLAYRELQITRKHKIIVVVADDISLKGLPSDCKMCFRSAPVIRWGDRRFWEKLRYAMPNKQRQHSDPKVQYSHQTLPNSNNIKLV